MPTQPFSYGEVRDLYDMLGQSLPQVRGMDLPTFSRTMNQAVGAPVFDAGLNDSVLKQASYQVDKLLRPVSQPLGQMGEAALEGVGLPQFAHVGKQMGEFLPRGVIEMGLPFTRVAKLGKLASLPGRTLGALTAGSRIYADTDSGKAGVLQGAFTALMPEFVQTAGKAATWPLSKLLYGEAGPKVTGRGIGMLEKFVESSGRNVGALVNQEAAMQAVSQTMGQGWVPYDTKHLTELAVMQAPFTALDLLGALPRPKPGMPRSPLEERKAVEVIQKQREVEDFKKTTEKEVESVLHTGLPKVEAVKQAKTINFIERHLKNSIDRAMVEGIELDLDRLHWLPPFPGETKPRLASALERDVIKQKLDALVARKVLEPVGNGYRVIGKIDVETAFKNSVQDLFPELHAMAMPGTVRAYHGTLKRFDEFSPEALGSNTGAPSAKEGFFFTSSPDVAESYGSRSQQLADQAGVGLSRIEQRIADLVGEQKFTYKVARAWSQGKYDSNPRIAEINALFDKRGRAADIIGNQGDEYFAASGPAVGMGIGVRTAWITLKNPKIIDSKIVGNPSSLTTLIRQAKNEGHDGLVVRRATDPGSLSWKGTKSATTYVVFNKESISNNNPGRGAIELHAMAMPGYFVKPGETTPAALQHPHPVGEFPKPTEYSGMSLDELGAGATDINSVVRGVAPPELLTEPAKPNVVTWPAPKTVGEVKPYLQKVWQFLREEANRLGRSQREGFKLEEGDIGWRIGGERATLPKPVLELYRTVEKQVLDRFGVAHVDDLAKLDQKTEASLGQMPDINQREDLANFVAQVRALLPKESEAAKTVLQPVPATEAESYGFVKRLIESVEALIDRATEVKLTKEGKEALALTSGLELGEKLAPAREQLATAGSHAQIYKLRRLIDEDYNNAVQALHDKLDYLPPTEVARRFYNLQMKRLRNLVEVYGLAQRPLETAIETALEGQTALMTKQGGVTRAEEAAVFDVLDRMSKGEVPQGQAVVNALAKLNADLDATGKHHVDWLYGQVQGGGGYKRGGTDLLTNFGVYGLFKRAASLADPAVWNEARNRFLATYKGMPDVLNRDELIAREWLLKGEYAQERHMLSADDLAVQHLKEMLTKEGQGDVSLDEILHPTKGQAGEFDVDFETGDVTYAGDPTYLMDVSAAFADHAGLAKRFPPGSPAQQAYDLTLQLFRSVPPEARTLEWWKGMKASVKFDADGQVDWTATSKKGAATPPTQKIIDGWNKAFEMVSEEAGGLRLYQRPDGSLSVKLARTRNNLGDMGVVKIEVLEEAGFLSAEKAKALRGERPRLEQYDNDVRKWHKAQGLWSHKVNVEFAHWVQQRVEPMLERVGGMVAEQMEVFKPELRAMRSGARGLHETFEESRKFGQEISRQSTEEVDKLRVLAGAKAFFDAKADGIGLSGEQKRTFSDVLTKTAAAFTDIGFGRLASLAEPGWSGAYGSTAFGKYFIGLKDPAEMAKLVKDPRRVAALLVHVLGHEFTHATFSQHALINDPMQERAIADFEAYATELGVEGRKTVLGHLVRLVEPTAVDLTDRIAGAADVQEFIADFGALIIEGFVSPDKGLAKSVKDFGLEMLFSDVHTQNYMQMLFAPLTEMAEALNEYFAKYVPQFADVQGPISEHVENMRHALALNNDRIASALQRFGTLEQFDRGTYERLMAEGWHEAPVLASRVLNEVWTELHGMPMPTETSKQAVLSASKVLGLTDRTTETAKLGLRPNFYERVFMHPLFLSRMYPVLRPAIDAAYRFHAYVNEFTSKIAEPFMTTTSVLKRKVLDYEGTGLRYLYTHPEANRVSSMIALIKNESLNKPAFTDEWMRDFMNRHGLRDTKAQQHVIDFHRAAEAASPVMQQVIVNGLRIRAARSAAKQLMMSNPEIRADQARAAGEQLMEAVWAARDPLQAGNVMVALQTIASFAPKVDKAMLLLKEQLDRVAEFDKRTAGQVNFMSEARLGENYLIWWDKVAQKHGSFAADSLDELGKYENKLRAREARGEVSSVKAVKRSDMQTEFSGLHPDFVKTLQEVEGAAYVARMMSKGFTNEEIAAHRDMYTPMEASLRQVEERGAEGLMRERKLTPGRETLNMARGYLHHIEAVSRTLAKSIVEGDAALAMFDPSIRGDQAMLNLARDHFNNVVHPTGKELSFLKRLNFSMFMGFNFSSMAIEGTQPLIMLTPLLTRDTGSAAAGYRFFGKALQSIYTKATSRNRSYGSAELDEVVERAFKDQVIDFGASQEWHDAESMMKTTLRSLAMGGEVTANPLVWGKTMLDSYARTTRWLYSFAPRMNAITSFLSTYRLAREHGVLREGKLVKLDKEAAYDYAKGTTREATLGGGTAGRPIGLFAHKGQLQGVVGLMYSLGTYSFGLISEAVTLGKEAILKSGMTHADKVAAQKAFGQMLFTQVALAGAMGLPLATAALALIEQMFPQVEATKTVEDTVRKMVGEDEDFGGPWTDIILRGVPYAGGVDLSSRLAISNLMGLSPYGGFSLANLMGPTGSVLANVYKAMRQGVEGKWAGAGETLLPTAWKNVVKLWRDDWVMRDANERVLLEPTPSELALDMFGFRPKRLQDMRAAVQMAKRGDEVWKLKNQLFHEEMAQRMMAGDMVGVQQALLNRQSEVSGYSAVAGARSVVDEVMDRSMPYDIAREGIRVNAAQRQILMQRAGAPRVGEVQRLMTKKSLERRIGIPGSGMIAPTELRMAQIEDQLMAANPLLSRQEAAQMAALLLGRRQAALVTPTTGALGPLSQPFQTP